MQDSESLVGRLGAYNVAGRRPFAYGRISVLYEGEDARGNTVCLKLFKEMPRGGEDLAEFFHELEAQQRLQHPNILPVLDFGEGSQDDPGPFIAYPLCKAGNLRQALSGRAYLPLSEAVSILAQVAAAIDYAHGSGFLHGDIKPENVLFLSHPSHPVLSDFGMSRRYPISEDVSSAVLGDDRPGGASAYLSPEELASRKQSTSSDIYSLAVLAYEMLTGTLPFDRESPPYQQMVAKVTGKIRDPVDANPALAPEAAAALCDALSVDPQQRPATAAEFVDALKGQRKRMSRKPRIQFWASLGPAEKTAIIAGLIAAVAAIAAALIQILPDLLE